MSTKKKIIISVISIVIIVGVIITVLHVVKKNSANSKTVNVYAVNELGSDYYYFFNDTSLSGSVSINMEQKIYPISSQKIKEIYVSEGDKVKAGDVIIEYDTTAQALQLETERTEVELARTAIIVAERELEELKGITPIEDMPQPTTEEPTTEETTTEEPTTEGPAPTEEQVSTPSDAVSDKDDNQTTEETVSDSGDEGDQEDIDSFDEYDFEVRYTREELAKAISDKQNEIKSLNTEYQLKEIEYEIMQYQVSNGQVLANFDGIVKTVVDEETALAENQAMIVISGNSGYTVKSSIGELSLDKVTIGEEVDLYCYDTGMSYTGTITDISMIPTDDNYNYSEILQTNYPMTINVDDADDLEQGMYMEITLPENDDVTSESYYLPMSFVKRDNDNYYVMKEVDGKLKKVYVESGKIIWGDTLEIKRGIGYNDYIAFPYSSDAIEGTKTKHAETDELYY